MKTFVIGDVHGNFKALKQVFERSGFDYENDKLISLGDIVDGYPQTRECIDELLKIKNLEMIIGNHDKWFLDWAGGDRKYIWASQGGQATFNSYIPQAHIQLFQKAPAYFVDLKRDMLFVHGGLDPNQKDINKQPTELLMWDRRLAELAQKRHYRGGGSVYGYKEIFIGHTATTYFAKTTEPVHYCNLWMMDTGAGWDGKLTIMDIDTKQFWQSDVASALYPGHISRGPDGT